MRHMTPQIEIDTTPECPSCEKPMGFAKMVDIAHDGRAHFIFRCSACGSESKLWRSEWQPLTEVILLLEE